MRQTTIGLFVFLLLLTLFSTVLAQNPKPADQKPATAAATDSEKPKNEVEELIAEANKHGEKVLGVCIDPAICREESIDRPLNLERGRAVHLAMPAYSPLARAAHVQGSVEVQVVVDEDGKVIAAAAISGHPLLQSACVKAARESLFTTTKLEGVPVKVTGVIQYHFKAGP